MTLLYRVAFIIYIGTSKSFVSSLMNYISIIFIFKNLFSIDATETIARTFELENDSIDRGLKGTVVNRTWSS